MIDIKKELNTGTSYRKNLPWINRENCSVNILYTIVHAVWIYYVEESLLLFISLLRDPILQVCIELLNSQIQKPGFPAPQNQSPSQWASMARYKQDMPPVGGYADINYAGKEVFKRITGTFLSIQILL